MSDSLPLLERAQFPTLFAPRRVDANKASHGSLGVIGGGPGMTGAALLAARAALLLGTGKVLVGFAQNPIPLPCDPLQPELMLHEAQHLLATKLPMSAWTAGCGIGTSPDAARALAALFRSRAGVPLVLDADGLNLLAMGAVQAQWGEGIVVLTPHPGEAARLLGTDIAQIQANRPAAARALATRYGAWIVLKGAGTIICAPDGTCQRNTTGNPGLASAGTGDVLAGMLGALLAQFLPAPQAIPAAVWLHGAAADALVAAGCGPIGLSASELALAARTIRNKQP